MSQVSLFNKRHIQKIIHHEKHTFYFAGIASCLWLQEKQETPAQQEPTTQVMPDTMPPHPIHGRWYLTRYLRPWSPTYNFSNNQIIWEFQNNHIILVDVNEGTDVPPWMPQNSTGEYAYSIDVENQVHFGNIAYYPFFAGDSLRLFVYNQNDGPEFTFYRAE